jgi:hypothetical protein
MVNGRTPLYLTVLAAAAFVGAILWFQPYSADFPGGPYAQPARRYIRAALKQDSVALSRLSISPRPVLWALHVARAKPESLSAWSGRVEAWTGERKGDTTQVWVYGAGHSCSEIPIELQFVGSGDRAKVAKAESKCLDPDTAGTAGSPD